MKQLWCAHYVASSKRILRVQPVDAITHAWFRMDEESCLRGEPHRSLCDHYDLVIAGHFGRPQLLHTNARITCMRCVDALKHCYPAWMNRNAACSCSLR